MKRLKVLVACERSGKVREAFRKLGHNAWSCDITPSDDDSLFHLQEDVLGVIARADLCAKSGEQWDLMIAHPPCTYLCNSGVRWLTNNPSRWRDLEKGMAFFNALANADIPHIAIENPIPHHHAVKGWWLWEKSPILRRLGIQGIGKYDQIIQPYMFGHAESKATCLWLKNLPKLVETDNVKDVWKSLPKKQAQRMHWQSPGPNRARIRSETYQGIADAMAQQWGWFVSEAINTRTTV